MDNVIINKQAIVDRCNEWGISLKFIFNNSDISRSALNQACIIKTNGQTFSGPLRKDVNLMANKISSLINLEHEDLIINIDNFKSKRDIGRLFINKQYISKMCKLKDRSVKWALDKSGIKYCNYNDMSYLFIKKGNLVPVRMLDVEKVKTLCEILECDLNSATLNVSKIK